MAAQKGVVFRRVNGRVIAMHGAAAAGAGAMVKRQALKKVSVPKSKPTKNPVTGNPFLKAAAVGSGIAAGVISGATMFSSGRKMLVGQAVSTGLDVATAALTAAAYAGKDNVKQRAINAAKFGAKVEAVSYGVWGLTMFGPKSNRARAIQSIRGGANKLSGLLRKVGAYG